MAYSGEDIKYEITITDKDGNPVNFSDVQSMSIRFFNVPFEAIVKTKADSGIVQGKDNQGVLVGNKFSVELQDDETKKLKKGEVKVEIELVLPNSDFSDNIATSIIKDKFTLE